MQAHFVKLKQLHHEGPEGRVERESERERETERGKEDGMVVIVGRNRICERPG